MQQARAEAKPEVRPKPEPRPETKKTDPAAFSKLLHDLEAPEKQEKKDRPDAFDSLLKNLTRQQTARAEEPTPAPKRMAALSPPSAQPKAPLGTELTASEIDIVRQQLSRCWNIPAGARDARDLVVTIRGSIAPDGRVLQATIVDQGQDRRPVFPRRGGKRAPRLFPSAMYAAASAAGKIRSVEDVRDRVEPEGPLMIGSICRSRCRARGAAGVRAAVARVIRRAPSCASM